MATNPTSKVTPASLTTPVMTDQSAAAIDTRIQALEKHYGLGENAIGCVFGRAPMIGNGTTMGYIGRLWLWNGLIDLATVNAPSLDTAVNRAFEDATLVLPQIQTQGGRSAKVA
jgi:hypothetical protein